MTFLQRFFSLGKKTIMGDKLILDGVDVLDLQVDTEQTGDITQTGDQTITGDVGLTGDITQTGDQNVTGAITASGAVTGATVADASGRVYDRKFRWEAASAIDLSAAAATITGPLVPEVGVITKVGYVVTEGTSADIDTAAIKVGKVDADGSSNPDDDAQVLGTTDEDNGLIQASKAVGYVKELTLGGADVGALAAGKYITFTHVQDADQAGQIIPFVEYVITGA